MKWMLKRHARALTALAVIAFGLLGIAVGCQENESRSSRATPRHRAEVSLVEMMDQTIFAFRDSDGQLSSQQPTYSVTYDGVAVSFEPKLPTRDAAAKALALRTERVGRNTDIGRSAATSRITARGGLNIDRGDVSEMLKNRKEGLEQSWAFARLPGGHGDLVVRVRASGQEYVGSSRNGLHFRDPQSGLGTLYGHATWVDAQGARTAVRSRHVGNHIELRVPSAVIEASAYPAVLDPIVSSEFAIDVPIAVSSAGGVPRVACGSTQCLVAWLGNGGTVEFARVKLDGTVLDDPSVVVDAYIGAAPLSVVANGDSEYIIAWYGFENGTVQRIATRIDPATAAIKDPVGQRIVLPTGALLGPAPQGYLAYWVKGVSPLDELWASRLQNGQLVDQTLGQPGKLIGQFQSFYKDAAVALGKNYFFFTWGDGLGVRAAVNGLTVIDSQPIRYAKLRAGRKPAATFDGQNFVIGWIYGDKTAWVGRVRESDGLVIDADDEFNLIPGSIKLPTGAYVTDIVAQFNGSKAVFFTHEDKSSPATAANSFDSLSTTPGSISVLSLQSAATGRDASYAAGNGLYVRGGVQGTTLSVSGGNASAGTSNIQISKAVNGQSDPHVASNGKDFLVVWKDSRLGAKNALYGTRIADDGTILDPTSLFLGGQSTSVSRWSVASDGINYLVAWEQGTSVHFTRVAAATGALLDAAPGVGKLLSNGFSPAVASDGERYLVVFRQGGTATNPGGSSIAYRRLLPDGTLVDTSNRILSYTDAWSLSAAGNTSPAPDFRSFFIAASAYGSGANYEYLETYILRSKLAVTYPAQQLAATAGARSTAVASDGNDFLVAWSGGATGLKVRAARWKTIDGTLMDLNGMTVADVGTAQFDPSVGFDGQSYLVGFHDARAGNAVYAARVATDGTLLDGPASSAGFIVSPEAVTMEGPSVASNGGGRSLVAFARIQKPWTEISRVYARFVDSAPYDAGGPGSGGTTGTGGAAGAGGSGGTGGTTGSGGTGGGVASGGGAGSGGSGGIAGATGSGGVGGGTGGGVASGGAAGVAGAGSGGFAGAAAAGGVQDAGGSGGTGGASEGGQVDGSTTQDAGFGDSGSTDASDSSTGAGGTGAGGGASAGAGGGDDGGCGCRITAENEPPAWSSALLVLLLLRRRRRSPLAAG